MRAKTPYTLSLRGFPIHVFAPLYITYKTCRYMGTFGVSFGFEMLVFRSYKGSLNSVYSFNGFLSWFLEGFLGLQDYTAHTYILGL